jgi:hypothetical protein
MIRGVSHTLVLAGSFGHGRGTVVSCCGPGGSPPIPAAGGCEPRAVRLSGSVPSQPPEALLGVAADHATRSIPIARPSESVGEVRAAPSGQAFESVNDVAVLDDGALAGVVPVERLLAAGGDLRIADVMDSDPRSWSRGPTRSWWPGA